jgi:hypothetical protein
MLPEGKNKGLPTKIRYTNGIKNIKIGELMAVLLV